MKNFPLSARSDGRAVVIMPGLIMFLIFVSMSAAQFHGYLFQTRGLDGLQIGILIMVGQCAGILSPLLQVQAIRKFHGPHIPLALMMAGAAVCLCALPHVRGFGNFLLVFPAFCFCSASLFPLNAAAAFEAMRHRGHAAFFKIRSLGTLGFLAGCLASLGFPEFRDLPWLYAGLAGALVLALSAVLWERNALRKSAIATESPPIDSLTSTPAPHAAVSNKSKSTYTHAPTFLRSLKLLIEGDTWPLLLALAIMNFANAMATAVQGNYLVERFAASQRGISMAWVVSTGSEFPLMWLCAHLIRKRGLYWVMVLGLAGTAIKLTGLALAGTYWQFCLALVAHGCFFSGAMTGFSVFLDRKHRPEDRASLQTISGVFHGGIPSALAGYASGWMWHAFSLQSVYWLAGALSLPTCLFGLWILGGPGHGKPALASESQA